MLPERKKCDLGSIGNANRFATSREFARDFPVWGVPYRHIGGAGTGVCTGR